MALIRVAVAEDNYLVREGILRLLDTISDLAVVAACADLDELMRAVDEHHPDVVITDIRMPPTHTDEGIQAAKTLRERCPDVGVVVLSQYAEPAYAVELFSAGSAGRAYLLKERVTDLDQIEAAVRAVAGGGSVVDPAVVDLLVASRSRQAASPLTRLTPREGEVLAEMASGKTNAAVAASLVLSERAVEKHINSIFSKLGLGEETEVHRRVKAVLLFLADRGG